MAAAIVGVGEQHLDRLSPGLLLRVLEHQRDIVGVADSEVALARVDIARLLAITTGRLMRQLLLYAPQPLFRCFLALVRDHRRDERDVVRMLPGSRANAPLPLGIS